MQELPVYPGSRELEISDKPYFDEWLRKDPPEISEFTFTNLFSWRNAYGFRVCRKDGFLLVLSQTRAGDFYYQPVGAGDRRGVIEAVLSDGKVFTRLPESCAAQFSGLGGYEVAEDPGNADYLYRREDLEKLSGRRYDGKRNFIRRFKAAYDYSFGPLSQGDIPESLEFIEEWCKLKDCASIKSLNHEKAAMRAMIENLSFFGLAGAAIRVKQKICAIALAEPLSPQTLVIHAMKARDDMVGLYPALLNEFVKLSGQGFEYINMEQDLGVEGLRKSKLSYHPVGMVKKFSVRKVKG